MTVRISFLELFLRPHLANSLPDLSVLFQSTGNLQLVYSSPHRRWKGCAFFLFIYDRSHSPSLTFPLSLVSFFRERPPPSFPPPPSSPALRPLRPAPPLLSLPPSPLLLDRSRLFVLASFLDTRSLRFASSSLTPSFSPSSGRRFSFFFCCWSFVGSFRLCFALFRSHHRRSRSQHRRSRRLVSISPLAFLLSLFALHTFYFYHLISFNPAFLTSAPQPWTLPSRSMRETMRISWELASFATDRKTTHDARWRVEARTLPTITLSLSRLLFLLSSIFSNPPHLLHSHHGRENFCHLARQATRWREWR